MVVLTEENISQHFPLMTERLARRDESFRERFVRWIEFDSLMRIAEVPSTAPAWQDSMREFKEIAEFVLVAYGVPPEVVARLTMGIA